jgi:AcrR family transcriptional regulator
MIEVGGVDKLSVNELATALGVKTPSLYRYFSGGRNDLLRAINEDTEARLYDRLNATQAASDSIEGRLLAIAHAYRDFAHANPLTYGLMYTNTIAELRPNPDDAEQRVLPLQALIAEVSGEADSHAALRGLWALVHGFIMLELAAQFQRSGDLDEAFVKATRAYLAGWRH